MRVFVPMRRTSGPTPSEKRADPMILKKGRSLVTFVYEPRDHCHHVALAGTFNNWQPEQGKMVRQKDGTFRKRLNLNPGEYRYKFLVDGEWIEDAGAERLVANAFGTRDALVTVG
jgi:1,4-alpha-glucan branching enzyme